MKQGQANNPRSRLIPVSSAPVFVIEFGIVRTVLD